VIVGENWSVGHTITPANATNKTLSWESSNNCIATVNAQGVLTARSPGTATITARTTDGSNISRSYTVTVSSPLVNVTGVTISGSSSPLTVGQTRALTHTVAPSNATNKAVTWSSSNSCVASVNSQGVVTARIPGTATITVTTISGNKTASVSITVIAATQPPPANVPVTGVSISGGGGSLDVGKTRTLTAAVTPPNATNKEVTWTSNDNSRAIVNGCGLVTGRGAGNVRITVRTTDGNRTAFTDIAVIEGDSNPKTDVISDIKITATRCHETYILNNENELHLPIGGVYRLRGVIEPFGAASNNDIRWDIPSSTAVRPNSNSNITGEFTVVNSSSARLFASVGNYRKYFTVRGVNSTQQVYALACATTQPNWGILTLEQRESNAQYIYNYLLNNGWTKNAICAFLGNVERESVLNPGAWEVLNNTTHGYGLIQWTPSSSDYFNRFSIPNELKKYPGSTNAERTNAWATSDAKSLMDTQLDFIIWECHPDRTSGEQQWWPSLTTSHYAKLQLQHGTPNIMTFAEFISSTHHVRDLTLVYNATRLRSGDDAKILQDRIENTNKWFAFFN
jgi:uncharacterized protein YjdB